MPDLILDLDIGNSRTKWRLSGGEERGGVLDNMELDRILTKVVSVPDRIRVACVAHDSYRNALCKSIASQWSGQIEFAQSEGYLAGVTNGYGASGQLGIDRWLAAIAAWNLSGCMPSLVVDAGSALTIDVVNERGIFLGGHIIPGLKMMQESLVSGTGRIQCETGCFPEGIFTVIPSNTRHAIQYGAAFAVCAAVQKAVDNFSIIWPHGKVHITGGDGYGIAVTLGLQGAYDPDLVFRGLALALP